MKKLLAVPVVGALLFAAAGEAVGAEAPQDQTTPKATMFDNANASAQATTDMSYGGTSDIQSASGTMQHWRKCSTGPQCNIYFGN